MDDEYVEAVLAVVASVGPGRVTTYGAVAAVVGRAGPRQVGRVMRLHGDEVAWWRVVHADGSPATCHDGTAAELLRAEGVPMRANGRVDLRALATGREA
jgi:alkylated DNA nucleotide flippase Atl1